MIFITRLKLISLLNIFLTKPFQGLCLSVSYKKHGTIWLIHMEITASSWPATRCAEFFVQLLLLFNIMKHIESIFIVNNIKTIFSKKFCVFIDFSMRIFDKMMYYVPSSWPRKSGLQTAELNESNSVIKIWLLKVPMLTKVKRLSRGKTSNTNF